MVRAHPLPNNMSRQEKTALWELKGNEKLVVLPADKGNASVVLDLAVYQEKEGEVLQDAAYARINNDPMKLTEWKLNLQIKTPGCLPLYRLFKPQSSKPPRICPKSTK